MMQFHIEFYVCRFDKFLNEIGLISPGMYFV